MLRIRVDTDPDLAALGPRWQSLEARADGSFFQGWGWTGCLLAERFPRPVLVSAERNGETVALGLFNARTGLGGERLSLGETGDWHDSSYIEHNGLLLDRREAPELEAACLEAVLHRPGWRLRRLVLGGVGERSLQAAAAVPRTRLRLRQARGAPFVDLAALRRDSRPFLATLSANARQQLRRSLRSYEAEGALALRRAGSTAEALAFLAELGRLHQASWTRRGHPGAFADPWFVRFHQALLHRAPGGTELLRVTAGERVVGFLYNLRHRDRVCAYQSGFDYAGAGPQRRPGLTCHHLAVEACLAEGALSYDFLAGEDRYKRSLSNARAQLSWAELSARSSLPALLGGAAALAGPLRRALARRPAGPQLT